MNRTTLKQLNFMIGFILLGLMTLAVVKIAKSQEPKPQDSSDVEAIRRGGLREAARIRGHWVGSMRTSHFLKYDLESLAAHSSNIIIGSLIDSSSHLSPDGPLITTWYRIKILQSLKGKLLSGETITTSLPGGKVVFEDGTSAEIKTPDFDGIQNDQTYVLFLSPVMHADGTSSPTGGSQGVFEIAGKGRRIKPNGHHLDPVQKHKDQDLEGFLEEIRAAVKKFPEVSACCN